MPVGTPHHAQHQRALRGIAIAGLNLSHEIASIPRPNLRISLVRIDNSTIDAQPRQTKPELGARLPECEDRMFQIQSPSVRRIHRWARR